jgi:hypothetical protein
MGTGVYRRCAPNATIFTDRTKLHFVGRVIIRPTKLAQAVQSLQECAVVCTVCADACLTEAMVAELRRCIRLNGNCACICRQ